MPIISRRKYPPIRVAVCGIFVSIFRRLFQKEMIGMRVRVFQIFKTTKKITEDFKIGFGKIWLYARHDAGGCARHPGKNNRCS